MTPGAPHHPASLRAGLGLWSAGVLALGALAWAPDGTRGAGLVALNLVLAAGMLLTWRGMNDGPRARRLVLGVAIAGQLALLAVPPFSTHDVERYLWDGSVAGAGLDPYRLAPAAPELAAHRERWPSPRDNTRVPTLYPPGALALFTLSAAAGPTASPWSWKALVTLAAIATCLLGARWLARAGEGRKLPLLALSPLLALEAGVGAHLDVFSLLAVTAALLVLGTPGAQDAPRRSALAGALLGLGALVKLLPGAAALPLLFLQGGRRLALVAALLFTGGYAAAFSLGLEPFGSTGVFFSKWRFGSPLHAGVEAVVGASAAGIFSIALTLSLLGLAVHLRRVPLVAMQLALAAPLIAAPVVFPWYALPLLPLVARRPSVTALLWLTALPFTYEVIDAFDASGSWRPASWPLWLLGAALVMGALFDLARRRRPHSSSSAPSFSSLR